MHKALLCVIATVIPIMIGSAALYLPQIQETELGPLVLTYAFLLGALWGSLVAILLMPSKRKHGILDRWGDEDDVL